MGTFIKVKNQVFELKKYILLILLVQLPNFFRIRPDISRSGGGGLTTTIININKETSQIVIFNSTIDFVSVVCEIVWRFPRRSYLIQSCSWPSTWTRNRKMIFRGGNFHAWLYHHLPLKWSKGLLVFFC